MRIRRRILLMGLFALLSRPLLTQTSDWTTVGLLAGHKVKVMTADGRSHTGNVQSVTDDSIRLGKDQLIQKQEIRQVQLWSGGHHGRNALIGLGIGAVAGIAFGAAAGCGKSDAFCFVSRGEAIAVGVPVFGGVGAGIGALLPTGRWREVYQSK